jgi:hypothetical protein
MKYITVGNTSINPDLVTYFDYRPYEPAAPESQQDELLRQSARDARLEVHFAGGAECEFSGATADSIKAALLAL